MGTFKINTVVMTLLRATRLFCCLVSKKGRVTLAPLVVINLLYELSFKNFLTFLTKIELLATMCQFKASIASEINRVFYVFL